MTSRGQKGAADSSGPGSGPMDIWLDKLEAVSQAHKKPHFGRRPGKEIMGGSPSKGNGPTGFGPKIRPVVTGPKLTGPQTQKGLGLVNQLKLEGNANIRVSSERPGKGNRPHPVGASNNGAENSGNFKGSWCDKIRVSSAKSRFRLDGGLAQKHRQPTYSVPDEFIEEDFGDWTRCLVGFIPGSPFPFYAARSIAMREWKSYGIEKVFSYEGFFIFRFHNEEKAQEVLADGPWFFGGKYMMLQQWHACFVFDKNKLSTVPVWVKLKGLPFTLWSNKALSFVAGVVGKPLSCDRATHERSRLSYARVCVEVDANKPYVHSFMLNCKLSQDPIRVEVEYEWKPQRCSKCCVYGHFCELKPIEGQKNGNKPSLDVRQAARAAVPNLGNVEVGSTLEHSLAAQAALAPGANSGNLVPVASLENLVVEPRKAVDKEILASGFNLENPPLGVVQEDDVLEKVNGREPTSDDLGRNKLGTITYADKLVGRATRTTSKSSASRSLTYAEKLFGRDFRAIGEPSVSEGLQSIEALSQETCNSTTQEMSEALGDTACSNEGTMAVTKTRLLEGDGVASASLANLGCEGISLAAWGKQESVSLLENLGLIMGVDYLLL